MPILPLSDEPRDLLLDKFNDLVIENGDFVLVRGIAAVMQSCRIALQLFTDEWFLNQDVGIPYWTAILGFKPAVAVRAAQLAIRAELAQISGVIQVTKVDVVFNGATRQLSITWQVKTGNGETPPDTIALAIDRSGVA